MQRPVTSSVAGVLGGAWRPAAGRAVVLLVALVVSLVPVGQAGAAPPDSTVPVPVTVPPGCDVPDPATAVFVGEVTATDTRTARYEVRQVRAGSLDGFEVEGLVDVDYFGDVRYLEPGGLYLVGVAPDVTGRLRSTVRDPAPLFGGNQVAGLDDTLADCPQIDDPVRTLQVDGSSVESGVLAPLADDTDGIVRALLSPLVWVFLALVACAAVKNLLWASGSEALRLARRTPPPDR